MAKVSTKKESDRNGGKRGIHPNSLNNLRPGKGRPKKELSLTHCAREKLKEPCPYSPGKTWLEYLVDRWLGQAVENASYFKELMERLEGKVIQPVGGEVSVNVKFIVGKGYADGND